MTTEERPERTQDESGHAKSRTHLLNVLGVVFFGAAGLVFGVVWKSMEPSDVDPMSEARCRADKELGGQPVPKARAEKELGGQPVPKAREDKTILDLLRSADPELLKYHVERERKAAEYYPYYAAELALAQGRQREAATKAMLVPAAAGVLCFILGQVAFRTRLMAAGILLLGLTAVYAAFLIAKKDVGEAEAAMYAFVIAVAGLSGLVCAALGMMRILAARKGT
ncbi:MAG: hypothetical protein NTX87_02380 [Planctomycetota bacterium]|nr:hypothetical protein [Planctomycetota bacterium]